MGCSVVLGRCSSTKGQGSPGERRPPVEQPGAGALSLASRGKCCGCIKYFPPPTARQKKRFPNLGARGPGQEHVRAARTMSAPDEMSQGLPCPGLCLGFILNYLCHRSSRSSDPGHRISRSLGSLALPRIDSKIYLQQLSPCAAFSG